MNHLERPAGAKPDLADPEKAYDGSSLDSVPTIPGLRPR
jgi:hypothetical protein